MTTPTPRTHARHQPPALPRIAALYARVSSKHQAGEDKVSLPTQVAALRVKAAEMGYAVVDAYIYQDTHTGEELYERPALSRLRADARGRHFGLVMAHSAYALAKNTAHLAILVDEWERLGIGLTLATEALEDSPVGRFMREAQAFAAEVEGTRRKERFARARRARAESGKPAGGSRPPYGYHWTDARRADGRLARERLEVDSVTGPVVQRMYQLVVEGQTLRAIAHRLTLDGIHTPTGKHVEWDQTTIVAILKNPLYCGQPMALRRMMVPVDKSVRHRYTYHSREVRRPLEEQVALPADYAPALVSRAVFDHVAARLRQNQLMASRNNRQPAATLVRGMIRCGHCGIAVNALNAMASGRAPARYVCGTGGRRRPGMERCAGRGITIVAEKVDRAVWAKVADVLRDPDLIAREVAAMHETEAPGAEDVATIDRQIAELDRRISNKHKFAELVDDDQERAELAAEVTQLRRDRRVLEAERTGAEARAADWQQQEAGLEQALEWCRRVAGHLDAFTFEERRRTLLALKAEVLLYQAGHTPRVLLTLHLPLSGALALPVGGAVCVEQHSFSS